MSEQRHPHNDGDNLEEKGGTVRKFCMFPLDAMIDSRLTPMDRCVLGIIVGFAGTGYECRPTYKMIADKIPCSIRTVCSSLANLEKSGWIERGEGDGEHGRIVVLKWIRPGAQPTARPSPDFARNRAMGWDDCAVSRDTPRDFAQPTACSSKTEYTRENSSLRAGTGAGVRPPAGTPEVRARARAREESRLAIARAQMDERERKKMEELARWGDDGSKPVEQWRTSVLEWQYLEGLDAIREQGLTLKQAEGNSSYELFWKTMGQIAAELERRGVLL